MKRIVLAFFLLTATCTATFVQTATAQTATVSATDFTTKVNLMDTQLAAGDVASATTTWGTINTMMKAELGVSKGTIVAATTDAERTAAMNKNQNQATLYRTIWGLKPNLATNRAALHTQLVAFAGTF